MTYRYLKGYFNIAKPRIAIAGLNPHAGEGGLFGNEEINDITPAIEEARNMNIDVSGPYPPERYSIKHTTIESLML